MRNSVRGWMGLLAALMLAPAAGALDITGLAINTTGTNTGALLNDNVTKNQVASSTSITIASSGPVADTIGSTLSVQTRYAWLVSADRDSNGSAVTQAATAAYQITFTVDNPTGATYRLDIDTLRLGVFSYVSDSTGNATIALGAASGTVGGVANAGFALPAIPAANNGAGDGTTQSTSFSQNGTQVQIVSSAIAQAFSLTFTWNTGATPVTSNNDEASLRMGISGSTAMTADDYASAAAASADGHFVTIGATIISAPEPEPLALVALGLVALALRARRIRD